MKTKMKFFAALAISMSFVSVAIAQNTDNDKISGKANVMQAMAVTKQVDLDFGVVAQGANKTIGLENDVTGWSEGTQTTGRFLVSAAAATSVDLTFTSPANLVNGVNNLPIDTYTYGWFTANTFTGGTTISSGADITMPTNVVELVNGIYVFVGATVKPGVSQVIGAYAADITLTATYN